MRVLPFEAANKIFFCPSTFFLKDDMTLLDTPAKIKTFLDAGLGSYHDKDA